MSTSHSVDIHDPALHYSDRQIEVLDAAARQFAQHGFAGTDVQAIADQIGIGKGTVYRAFSNKEALFLAAVDREIQLLVHQLTAAAESDTRPRIRFERAVREYLTFFDARPWAAELLILERAVFRDRQISTYLRYLELTRTYWESLFNELCRDGTFRSMSPAAALDLVSDVLYGSIFTNHFAGHKEPYSNKAGMILDVLMNGMLERPEMETHL